MVPLSGGYGVATASADTQYTDLLRVHGVEVLEIIDRGVDIAHTLVWIFKKIRFSPTSTLEGRIIDDRRESGFGKPLRVCPSSLFFDTAARVDYNKARCLARRSNRVEEKACEAERVFFNGDFGHCAGKFH